jgi:signal transduction histidine kinase
VTTVEEGDAPVAAIIHAASALDDPELLRAATSAVRLAVGNVALRGTVHEQMAALTHARRRIVEAADLQRSAVAARLEEGAGRHLARVDALLAPLDAACDLRSELARARADLLDLAHGVRPQELAQEGLSAALSALAARSAMPTTLDLRLGRMPPAVESALYFVCAEALTNVAKHANARTVVIRGRESDAWAEVEVADDGSGGADAAGSGLRGLMDRVEALGGQLRVDTGNGGTVVSARLPLSAWDLR